MQNTRLLQHSLNKFPKDLFIRSCLLPCLFDTTLSSVFCYSLRFEITFKFHPLGDISETYSMSFSLFLAWHIIFHVIGSKTVAYDVVVNKLNFPHFRFLQQVFLLVDLSYRFVLLSVQLVLAIFRHMSVTSRRLRVLRRCVSQLRCFSSP